MMKDGFYLFIHFLPTVSIDPIGQFYLGPDKEIAISLFNDLKGIEQITSSCFLFMELMEYKEGLPLNLLLKSCTLPELGENCKLVTKELFKITTLEKER